jgi:hypothetical protein
MHDRYFATLDAPMVLRHAALTPTLKTSTNFAVHLQLACWLLHSSGHRSDLPQLWKRWDNSSQRELALLRARLAAAQMQHHLV